MSNVRSPFRIDSRDLATRRSRCKPLVDALRQRLVSGPRACNVCGADSHAIVTNVDRYGLPVQTLMCTNCGLIQIGDRLTAHGYDEFYKSGAYRKLTSNFSGTRLSVEEVKRDQSAYSAEVITLLSRLFRVRAGGTLLDVGGSVGIVAREVASSLGVEGTVLDPSREEIAEARAAGIHGIASTFERFETVAKYDVILLCRSIEHLFDLRGSILKMRSLLSEGGLLFCDIVDFVECCRLTGTPQAVAKIDHCYWLCQETAPRIFASLGLRVVSTNTSSDPECIQYVLERCEPTPSAHCDEIVLHRLIRRLRECDSDWRQESITSASWSLRLRWWAYRNRRRAWRTISRWRPSRLTATIAPQQPSSANESDF